MKGRDTAKKILPAHSRMILAFVEVTWGIVTDAKPVLGAVPRGNEKLAPSFVESRITTLAAEIGARLVPPTLQEMLVDPHRLMAP